MKSIRLVALALLIPMGFSPAGFGQSGNEIAPPQASPDALPLLEEAHELVSSLPPEQQAWAALEVVNAMALVRPSRGTTWAKELWPLSQRLPLTPNRVALQKNILRVVAATDPDSALSLARMIRIPDHFERIYSEDPRSVGSIFHAAWQDCGTRCLDQLLEVARYNASTGQYPYGDIEEIVLSVAKTDSPAANRILVEATDFYRRDPGFESTKALFTRLILNTKAVATKAVLQGELRAAAAGIPKPSALSQPGSWALVVKSSQGETRFTSHSQQLLYLLLPLMRQETPELVPALLERYQSLRTAPVLTIDTPVQVMGGVVRGGSPNSQATEKLVDGGRVSTVQQLAGSDPARAFTVTDTISDPDLHTLALVSLAPSYRNVDADEAETWLQQATKQLSTMPVTTAKLDLALALLNSQLTLDRTDSALDTLSEGLDAAEALQHPDQSIVEDRDEIVQLAFIAGKTPELRQQALARAQQVEDPRLKSLLLASLAEGIAVANGELKL